MFPESFGAELDRVEEAHLCGRVVLRVIRVKILSVLGVFLLDMGKREACMLCHDVTHAATLCWVGDVCDGVHSSEHQHFIQVLHELMKVIAFTKTNRQSTTVGLEPGDILSESALVWCCGILLRGRVESVGPVGGWFAAGPCGPFVFVQLDASSHLRLWRLERGAFGRRWRRIS